MGRRTARADCAGSCEPTANRARRVERLYLVRLTGLESGDTLQPVGMWAGRPAQATPTPRPCRSSPARETELAGFFLRQMSVADVAAPGTRHLRPSSSPPVSNVVWSDTPRRASTPLHRRTGWLADVTPRDLRWRSVTTSGQWSRCWLSVHHASRSNVREPLPLHGRVQAAPNDEPGSVNRGSRQHESLLRRCLPFLFPPVLVVLGYRLRDSA